MLLNPSVIATGFPTGCVTFQALLTVCGGQGHQLPTKEEPQGQGQEATLGQLAGWGGTVAPWQGGHI